MAIDTYDARSTMREGRARYFERNAFGADGGYSAKWVNFKLGPLTLTIPNTAGRVRAVAFHDLHHVLTDYGTDPLGEFEISAWEIGAGCKDFYAAWFINLGGVAGGLLFAPRRTFRAFVRGRHCRTLYGQELEPLLDRQVGELRAAQLTPQAERAEAKPADVARLALSAALGFASGMILLPVGLIAAPLVLGSKLFQRAVSLRTETG